MKLIHLFKKISAKALVFQWDLILANKNIVSDL